MTVERQAASAIEQAFEEYRQSLAVIMRRARLRFEHQDWHGMQADAVERLDLREQVLGRVVADVRRQLGDHASDRAMWVRMKRAYSGLIAGRCDFEMAETFFNSATRRIFDTVGVDADLEYAGSDFEQPPAPPAQPVYATIPVRAGLAAALRTILKQHAFHTAFRALEQDAEQIAAAVERHRQSEAGARPVDAVDVLRPLFFRGQGAYLIGRLCSGEDRRPLLVALKNEGRGIYADAVLLTEDEVSIVFSFTRAYFHVEAECPRAIVEFLRSIMPQKPMAELYIALGYYKHGKTELYRDLQQHMAQSDDRFIIAPGDRGMVMLVFTLASRDLVFKVIRDRFAPPKTLTRQDVLDRYDLVFKHDRAGRLVDAQEFERLVFARDRFAPDLLDELTSTAADSVTFTGAQVVLKHVYVERRITPLNLFLRQDGAAGARQAVLDYGQAIKDLAATNIFPGDLLLKNFGVTRHGRVIFYDYDELCLLTDCQFRDLPSAGDLDDEMRAEPWFYVGERDIFPEEFLTFIGFQAEARQAFLEAHADLVGPAFWREMQARHRAGELIEIPPYPVSRRLWPS